ncbi:hypothetical protein [Sphingomonas sp. Leaf257]|jgi:hypothetical protein|uniref:hypothetical protein n=1 Tax=Sphingomonas sp. Leaf257 TaxID=1736309 RepID=UPI000700038B|nr:hypothetical protein [Sphingomonas sp. Leaf257]KQO58412.1 hypothetical protein ASF14_00120 [Sphingomonas sp. Leaf257]
MLDATGNITLNRADTFTFALDYQDENGSPINLTNSNITLYVDKVFSLTPTAANGKLYFTFTPAHAVALQNKEYEWIIREVVNGVPDVLVSGGTISAEGFAV